MNTTVSNQEQIHKPILFYKRFVPSLILDVTNVFSFDKIQGLQIDYYNNELLLWFDIFVPRLNSVVVKCAFFKNKRDLIKYGKNISQILTMTHSNVYTLPSSEIVHIDSIDRVESILSCGRISVKISTELGPFHLDVADNGNKFRNIAAANRWIAAFVTSINHTRRAMMLDISSICTVRD